MRGSPVVARSRSKDPHDARASGLVVLPAVGLISALAAQ